MTRQYFDELIGDPPVSTVDIDGVIAAQRGGQRRRRAGVAVAVSATVLSVTLGVGVALGVPPIGGPLAGPSGTPTPTRTPTRTPTSSVPAPDEESPSQPPQATGSAPARRGSESNEDVQRRLSEAMRAAVLRVAPNAETWGFGSSLAFQFDAGNGSWTPGPGRTQPRADSFSTLTVLRVGALAGRLDAAVMVHPAWSVPEPGKGCFDLPNEPCPVKSGYGPGGSRYAGYHRLLPEAMLGPPNEKFQVVNDWAQVIHADGTAVYVSVYNFVFAANGGLAPGSTKPPLTIDQLIAVAVDPALYP
jgi:hypothetical protein